MRYSRRYFIRTVSLGAGTLFFIPEMLFGNDTCKVMHPLMPPDSTFKEECHNCGMKRAMWARTWYIFKHGERTVHTCSLHCMAESSLNRDIAPSEITTALYLDPHTMVAAEKAHYVVGSSSRGTMTMKSKLVFASKAEAVKFAGTCGGEITDFMGAYTTATKSIAPENSMINKNRVRKGKLVEPVDNKDKCPVCGMYAARYPKNKCQLTLKNGEVVHFCATQCLFEYLAHPLKYSKSAIQKNLIWVIDFDSGNWIYGPNAFYVIDSTITGPMGKEAIPFINKEKASMFTAANRGKIVAFQQVVL